MADDVDRAGQAATTDDLDHAVEFGPGGGGQFRPVELEEGIGRHAGLVADHPRFGRLGLRFGRRLCRRAGGGLGFAIGGFDRRAVLEERRPVGLAELVAIQQHHPGIVATVVQHAALLQVLGLQGEARAGVAEVLVHPERGGQLVGVEVTALVVEPAAQTPEVGVEVTTQA